MSTHRINVTARNVDHWSWSLNGGADTMMPAGSTYADITINPPGGGSPPAEQPEDLTSPITCYRSSVVNKGVGFTSIQSLFDLFPQYTKVYGGDGNHSTIMAFTTPSGTGSNGSLNSDGGIELFCATNHAFDVYEDNYAPPTHTFYFVQDPLELWIKAEVGNNSKWSKGGTNSQYNDTPPNLADRIYAKVSYNFLFDH